MAKSTKMKQKTQKKFYYKGVKAREKWEADDPCDHMRKNPTYLCTYSKGSIEYHLWWKGFNGVMVSKKREHNVSSIINRARALLTRKH